MTKLNVKDKLQDEILDLSLCDLEEVPVREIAMIKKAKNVDLSNNLLVSLPKTFITLTQIIKLDLSKNMLTELPENFGDLIQLRHLDLYSNNISRLPLSLGNLKNLKWLDLKENPLTSAVASVAGPCSNASECQACARKIVSYLSNVQYTIEEEKQRRINIISEKERSTIAEKKEGKKKKRNKKKNTEKDGVEKNSEQLNLKSNNLNRDDSEFIYSDASENSKKKTKIKKSGIITLLCRAFLFLLLWTVFFSILIILATIIFTIYDKRRSEETFKYLEIRTKLPIIYYHQLGKNMIDSFMKNTVIWTNYTQIRITKYYNQFFV